MFSINHSSNIICNQWIGKTFLSVELQRHLIIDSIMESIVHSCAFCDYQSDDKANLKENVKSLENPESYLCQYCAIQCKNKNPLLHHIKMNYHKYYHTEMIRNLIATNVDIQLYSFMCLIMRNYMFSHF